MSKRAKKAFGGHWALKRRQREAEKIRTARNLCRCSDDFRFFDSKEEHDAELLRAEPVICGTCGRAKLLVAIYITNRPGAPALHSHEICAALIDGFIKR